MANQQKPRKLVAKQLHILHASSLLTLTNDQAEADLRNLLGKNPDVYGTTETHTPARIEMMRKVGKDMGYTVHHQPNIGEPFMVKIQDNLKVHNVGRVLAQKGNGLPRGSTNLIDNRYISWLHLKFWGLDLFTHITHWQAHTEESALRTTAHVRETRVMAAQVKLHGVGNNISFFQGDLNYDENDRNRLHGANSPLVIFREQSLKIIWDELGSTPAPTFENRAIDVIGRYMHDDRVKGKRYKVYPRGNSDHRAISSWYDVEVRKKTVNNDPPPKEKPPIYATGGDIDWSDYDDNSLYPLPYAVDDSDTTNG